MADIAGRIVTEPDIVLTEALAKTAALLSRQSEAPLAQPWPTPAARMRCRKRAARAQSEDALGDRGMNPEGFGEAGRSS